MRGVNTCNPLPKPDMSVAVTVFFMSLLVLVALWTRFIGLGDRQLAQDEYYFIKSVQNIIEFGVPRDSSGGYYTRGILLQYLTAISIYVFGDGGFAYRFPMALFGIGTVIAAYFLGRQFLNRSWSIVLVAMLTFSSWEIEFSRFARMYPMLQFVAVCFYWSLYRYSFNGDSNKRYLAVAFAMIAILTHALGIFLAALLFLPFPALFNRNLRTTLWEQRIYLALSSMVLGIGYIQATGKLHLGKVTDSLPLDFIMPHAKAFHCLSFGIGWFGNVGMVIAAVMAVCLAGGYVLYTVRNRIDLDAEEQFLGALIVLAVCLAMVHQFAMCTLVTVVVVLRQPRLFFKKPYLYFFVLLSAVISFWLVLLWFSQTWADNVGIMSNIKAFRRSIRLNFFVFPDFYIPVLRTWADKVPVLAVFLGVGVAYQIIYIRKLSWARIARHPVILIVLVVIAMGVKKSLYSETRYSYFLYPLLLCVALLSASRLGEILNRRFKRETLSKTSVIALCLLAFGVSEDFNSFHLLHLNSDIIAFRSGKYDRFSSHWYQRWDFKQVAEFLDANTSETSRIILSREVDTIAFYLDKEFIFYWAKDSDDYTMVSRDRGTREVRSGKPMISTTQEVIDLAENAKSVWLVFYPKWRTWELNPEAVWPGRVKSVEVYKPGRDKRIEVWKIELRGAE